MSLLGTDSGSTADIWISDRKGYIGEFNPATGALVPGTFHHTIGNLTDIAFIGNQMYGTTLTGLYKIDDTTGKTTLVGKYNFTSEMNGMIGDGNSLLLTSRTSDLVYKITGTNVTEFTSTPYDFAGDLAWVGHTLYESVVVNGVDALYNVTAHKLIGNFHTADGSTENTLYGLTDTGTTMYGVTGNEIFRVNLASAELTAVSSDATSGIGNASGAAFVGESAHR